MGAAPHASLQMTSRLPAVADGTAAVVVGVAIVEVVAPVVVVAASEVVVVSAATAELGVVAVVVDVVASAAGAVEEDADVPVVTPPAVVDGMASSPVFSQIKPPVAPPATKTPNMARKRRRLTLVSLTGGDGSNRSGQ